MKKKAIHAGKRVKKMFVMIIAQFEDPYYQGVAAQIAFSLFLSIVPILILTSQLLGLFSLSLDEIRHWIGDNVSVEGTDQLLSFLEDSPSGANNIFLAVYFAVIAYLISAMFGNSMYYTSPYFFILLGMVMNFEKTVDNKQKTLYNICA